MFVYIFLNSAVALSVRMCWILPHVPFVCMILKWWGQSSRQSVHRENQNKPQDTVRIREIGHIFPRKKKREANRSIYKQVCIEIRNMYVH